MKYVSNMTRNCYYNELFDDIYHMRMHGEFTKIMVFEHDISLNIPDKPFKFHCVGIIKPLTSRIDRRHVS